MRKIYLLLVGSLLGFNSYSQNVPTNGLVAFYKFSNNINDVSPNAYNLTNNFATFQNDRFNSVSALGFQSSGNHCLYRVNGNDLAVTGNDISISFWYKTTNSFYSGIIDNTQGSNSYGIDTYNGQMRFLGGGNFSAPVFSADGRWHHIVFTKSGSKGIFYKDGLPTDSTNAMTSILAASGSQQFNVGRRNIFTDYYNGYLDDIAIFNRPLTALEIEQMYRFNDWAPVPVSGLLAHYPFTGMSINDFSGANHTLSNSGALIGADRFGNAQDARNFSGGANCLYITNGNSLPITGNGISMSFWYKTGSSGYTGFIDNTQSSNSYGIDNYNGNFRFLGGGNFSAPVFNPDNQWHHIVFTKNANIGIFYVDGVSTYSTNAMTAITIANGSQMLVIGSRNVFGSYLNGSIDDIALYSRPLNAGEVKQIYEYNDWNNIVTSTSKIDVNDVASIYPNPANEMLNIELKNLDEPLELQLVDITGRTVIRDKIQTRTTQLNISALNSGVYFLTVITEKGQSIHKIIKQ